MKLAGMLLVTSLMVVIQTGLSYADTGDFQVLPEQPSLQNVRSCLTQQQVSDLNKSIDFLKGICACSAKDLASWFKVQGSAIDRNVSRLIKNAVANNNDRLSFQGAQELKDAATLLERHGIVGRPSLDAIDRKQIKKTIEKYARCIPLHAKRALSLLSVANWFWNQAKTILSYKKSVEQSLQTFLKNFPSKAVAEKVTSPTLKKAILAVGETGRLADFFAAWDALEAFLKNNQSLNEVFALDFAEHLGSEDTTSIIVKDFTSLAAVLMEYVLEYVTQNAIEQKTISVDQLLNLYNKINELPIIEAISTLGALATQFSAVLDMLRQQDGNVDLGQWLKNNWVIIPVVVGVIVVKVAQYFYPQQIAA